MELVAHPSPALDRAIDLMEAGEAHSALPLLRPLVQQRPSDGQLHALIGICYAQVGNLEAAVKSLETGTLLSPGDIAVEHKLACVLCQAGKLDQARWRLTRVLEADPEHEEAKQLLAHVQASTAPPPPAAPTTATRARAPAAPRFASARPRLQAAAAGPHPSVGLRILRGTGWGLLYGQTWTLCSVLGAVLLSLLTTRVEHAIIAFVVLALLTTLFHSAMGVLTGVAVAVMNADEDTAAWIGGSVGFLILLIGLQAGFLALWSVVFYLLSGIWIGRSVAAQVQKPLPA